jgi:hypothetical protein
MEEFANDYEDIDSGGGFSSSDTKSRCQSEDMSTRPQFVFNAPDPAYVAVPLQFDRNTKQMPTVDAEKYDKMAVMTGEEDVNIVASVVNTRVHGKAVLFPYAKTYLDSQGANFIDQNIGDDFILVDESEGGEDVTKAGADKEGEKLQLKRVARRIPKKKTNTLAPVVDKDYFTKEYKSNMLRYWTDPYKEKHVLAYMNIGKAARQTRGRSYTKFIRTLYLLGNEYLSPEEFIKSDGKLFKWETNIKMRQGTYGGMDELALNLARMKDSNDDDWCLAGDVSFTMYLWDLPDYNKKESWNPWVSVSKSTIGNAGNGLFAAREFQKGETIGFYVGNVVYKYPKKWTAKASEEFLQEQQGFLEDDSRTMTLVDKKGFRVVVNPCYGRNREKIANPPLLMGIHFLNDFTKIYDDEMGESLKEKVMKHNNVWVDDQGGVKATKRIRVGQELLLSYEGKRRSYVDRKPKATVTAEAKATGTMTTEGPRKKKK